MLLQHETLSFPRVVDISSTEVDLFALLQEPGGRIHLPRYPSLSRMTCALPAPLLVV